jgi:hypothetical protein
MGIARSGVTPALAFWWMVAAILTSGAREAKAFCRTTTCSLPADFSPSPSECFPADFALTCASQQPPRNPLPAWWRSACIGYHVQRAASRQVDYDTAAAVIARAFSRWTSTACPWEGSGNGRVSIDVRDLGPIDGEPDPSSGQNVILFRDDEWPYADSSNTLAVTTLQLDPASGEILSAKTEINATVLLSVGDPVAPDGYDLESIVTHEAGHFLGIGHSPDPGATMYAYYEPGSASKRELDADDLAAECAVYPPDYSRSVDPSVKSSGELPAGPCVPTATDEALLQPPGIGCRVDGSGGDGQAAVVTTLVVLVAARLSKRRARLARSRATSGVAPTDQRGGSRACSQ